MTHTPTQTTPINGTRNQKNGSCEPRRRSFFLKSMAASVALPLQPQMLFEFEGGCGAAELDARENDMTESTSSTTGKDLRRQASIPSAKDMKTPVSSYVRNCF